MADRTLSADEWLRERGLPPLERAQPVDTYCRRIGDRFEVHAEQWRGRPHVVLRDLRGGRVLIPVDLAVDVSRGIDNTVTSIVADEVKKGAPTK